MNEKIKKILEEQERLDAYGSYAVISRETGRFFNLLMQMKKPKAILEVGTSIGYSTVWLASASPKDSKVVTIERWLDRADIAEKFFKRAKLNIRLIRGDAMKVMPKARFDVVFLDGTKSEYLRYLKKVNLNKHALIIADNTVSHESKMEDFLRFAKKHGGVNVPIGKGVTLLYVDEIIKSLQ